LDKSDTVPVCLKALSVLPGCLFRFYALPILIFSLWPVVACRNLLPPVAVFADCVALVHRPGRSDRSYFVLQQLLAIRDYTGVVLSYPSIKAAVFALVQRSVSQPFAGGITQDVHFITHSMTVMLLRLRLADNRLANLGKSIIAVCTIRALRLLPPNCEHVRSCDRSGHAYIYNESSS
jgi:hypothetical protein